MSDYVTCATCERTKDDCTMWGKAKPDAKFRTPHVPVHCDEWAPKAWAHLPQVRQPFLGGELGQIALTLAGMSWHVGIEDASEEELRRSVGIAVFETRPVTAVVLKEDLTPILLGKNDDGTWTVLKGE